MDGVLELCSLQGFPADKERLLREVAASEEAYRKAFNWVAQMMKVKAP